MEVMRAGTFRASVLAAAGLTMAACAASMTGSAPVALEASVLIRDHPVPLRLKLTPRHATDPLLFYATGDGGWGGNDKDIFDRLVASGYPVAGFSAPDYLAHLAEGAEAISPQEMAADFAALIRASKAALNLPATTRVVLVGNSRGAGLSVAVAAQEAVHARLRGVIAIALTREEEFVGVPSTTGGPPAMLLTYPSLPAIGAIPVAVIQSTHDDYIPAAEARALFGPDTDMRTFRPIESTDHTFQGGVADLYREMTNCFAWILQK
jgi:fermentation-respiration switch protein FrsA (DUF1100 family)